MRSGIGVQHRINIYGKIIQISTNANQGTHANENFSVFFSRILCHIKSKVKNFYIFIKEFAFFVCVFTILCRMYGMSLASAYILRCLPLNGKVFESRRKTAIKPAYCSSCFYIHFVCFNFIPRFECRLRI